MPVVDGEGRFIPTFLARQPIFDRKQRTVGYELLFRSESWSESANIEDMDKATADVAASAISGAAELLGSDDRIWVNFAQQTLLDKVPYALPAIQTVIQVPEEVLLDASMRETMVQLKQSGYKIAANDFTGKLDAGFQDVLDYVTIDMLGVEHKAVQATIAKANGMGVTAVAKRVEDVASYDAARNMGFALFQGYFFRRPEIIAGRKLTSHEASRFRLLQAIESREPDFDRLATVIQHDVSISFRLLAYLNSASFSFRDKIKSVKQALVLLGWNQLKSWLRLIILTDMTPKKDNAPIFLLSLHRATFFKMVGTACDSIKAAPDNLYLLGLFSLLEALLGMPMKEIMTQLPLDDDIKQALAGEENEYSAWLDMAEAFEGADWMLLDQSIRALGCNSLLVAMAYYDSLPLVKEFMCNSGASIS
ncbi:MAG: EAL and HDOD domain-containing protein [Desulfovibrionaceae bacterium]